MRLKSWLYGLLALGLVLAGGLTALRVTQAQDDDSDFTWAGDQPAPEFPADLEWLNVPEPLSFADLEGKIVLLDFWTYGCVNCMHVIPDYKQLEAEFPDTLVVIGIHSAKFETESVTANIRQIAQRYGISHPIVNDNDLELFTRVWGARAWPTAILIDPLGRVVGAHSGEGIYNIFQPILATMVEEYGEAGLLDRSPIALDPVTADLTDTPLSFPGKVLVDEAGGRLFIADSGHNRIVVASLDDYEVLAIIGSGEEGLNNADFASSSFNNPQGMALVEDTLYVADTDNHVIRAVDLAAQRVRSIAGTGEMSQVMLRDGLATETALRSPWDLLAQDGTLYVAMAGTHQIFTLDLSSGHLSAYAGDGGEDLIDGPRPEARFAQPSGLASDGRFLYVADSEASAIRQIDLAENGQVETVIGPVDALQGRLFIFGDVDGGIDEARLQHPLGVTVDEEGLLYIADTYNNKIKRIDPAAHSSRTLSGSTEDGYLDGSADESRYDEPGGLDYSNGRLYIADTNNHIIRVVDVADGSSNSVIFPNVALLLDGTASNPEDGNTPLEPVTIGTTVEGGDGEIALAPQTVKPGEGLIMVDAIMPFGYKLNDQAPFTAIWSADEVAQVAEQDYRMVLPELPIEFETTFVEGQTSLSLELVIYWCEAINETLCFVDRRDVVMPIVVDPNAAATVAQLQVNLIPPDAFDDGGAFGN